MMSKLHKCMMEAKRQKNIDLFRYLEGVYENGTDTDHMFIGESIVCQLYENVCAMKVIVIVIVVVYVSCRHS